MSSTQSDAGGVQAIRDAFESLDRNDIISHFTLPDGDAEPYVVCCDVGVDSFNAYIRLEEENENDKLLVELQFLELDENGRLSIVDLPTTTHEAVSAEFEDQFIDSFWYSSDIAIHRSFTAHRPGACDKAPDVAFGPLGSTPHRGPPPEGRNIGEWVTFAVDVAESQPWASIEHSLLWWSNYAGIQYGLGIKVTHDGLTMRYALYDFEVPHAANTLPPPIAHGQFSQADLDMYNPVMISIDTHRVLAIPANMPLPLGKMNTIEVDLSHVMEHVMYY
ncbi:hypothetical protein DYB37_005965 [Aphanomyces astaci]|uniref:Uncharacterized protein n=2 Tax=Aphanomyces astaci TaxID=112090 RepID=A0A418F9E6_APHAT|nr:hypothetical protein DYB37_005965 [Aphanomyces astaci]